jgi:hypothetical protein
VIALVFQAQGVVVFDARRIGAAHKPVAERINSACISYRRNKWYASRSSGWCRN